MRQMIFLLRMDNEPWVSISHHTYRQAMDAISDEDAARELEGTCLARVEVDLPDQSTIFNGTDDIVTPLDDFVQDAIAHTEAIKEKSKPPREGWVVVTNEWVSLFVDQVKVRETSVGKTPMLAIRRIVKWAEANNVEIKNIDQIYRGND